MHYAAGHFVTSDEVEPPTDIVDYTNTSVMFPKDWPGPSTTTAARQ
jgi:hypothetical protein